MWARPATRAAAMRAPAPATHSGRETDLSQAVYAIAAANFITWALVHPRWDAGAQEFLTGGVVPEEDRIRASALADAI
jgi:hypothetical protein